MLVSEAESEKQLLTRTPPQRGLNQPEIWSKHLALAPFRSPEKSQNFSNLQKVPLSLLVKPQIPMAGRTA